VDVWNPSWSVSIKRGVIANSISNHQLKGTRKAVQDAIESMGAGAVLTEWWETTPSGSPHTFDVLLSTGAQGATDPGFQDDLQAAITAAKPLRSHFTVIPAVDLVAQVFVSAALQVVTYNRISLTG
jgi:phage tail P2-like protein